MEKHGKTDKTWNITLKWKIHRNWDFDKTDFKIKVENGKKCGFMLRN